MSLRSRYCRAMISRTRSAFSSSTMPSLAIIFWARSVVILTTSGSVDESAACREVTARIAVTSSGSVLRCIGGAAKDVGIASKPLFLRLPRILPDDGKLLFSPWGDDLQLPCRFQVPLLRQQLFHPHVFL